VTLIRSTDVGPEFCPPGASAQSPFLSSRAPVPTQVPLWHESVRVQSVPSLQAVPSGRLFVTQPRTVSHVVTLHGLRDERQDTGELREHEPLPLQASPVVHAFESLHRVPEFFGGFVHEPVAGWQMPTL
jgi:hypothetical protein